MVSDMKHERRKVENWTNILIANRIPAVPANVGTDTAPDEGQTPENDLVVEYTRIFLGQPRLFIFVSKPGTLELPLLGRRSLGTWRDSD